MDTLPITAKQIANETAKDKFHALIQALQSGKQVSKAERFNLEQVEFSLHKGVIIHGHQVIPKALHPKILKELHSGHFGVVKMKNLARSYCWWPNIDCDIENAAKSCPNCNAHRNNLPKTDVHAWHLLSAPM